MKKNVKDILTYMYTSYIYKKIICHYAYHYYFIS